MDVGLGLHVLLLLERVRGWLRRRGFDSRTRRATRPAGRAPTGGPRGVPLAPREWLLPVLSLASLMGRFSALPAFWPARSAGQDSALADFSRIQDSRKIRQTPLKPSTSAAFPPIAAPSTGFLGLFESRQYQKSWPGSFGGTDVRRCADLARGRMGQKVKGRELGGRSHRGGAGEDLDVGAVGLHLERVATPRRLVLPIRFTNSSDGPNAQPMIGLRPWKTSTSQIHWR